MAGHAVYSASAAQRWLNCPVSVRLSAGLDTAGRDARLGTLAHALADAAIRHGIEKALQLPEFAEADEEPDAVQVDDVMIEHVVEYVDWIYALVGKHPGCEWEAEAHLDMSDIHPLTGGTADFHLYDPAQKLIHVVDFKYGTGKIVEPTNNPQCLTYLLGVLLRHHNRGVRRARITIYQPRGYHPEGTIRTWETDVGEILAHAVDIRDAIDRAEQPGQQPKAGPWCKDGFCAVRASCMAYRDQTFVSAMADFEDAPDGTVSIVLPDRQKLSPAQRAALLNAADQINDWIKQVQEEAHDAAMAGDILPGWKLVPKRGRRKWVVDETDVLTKALRLGRDVDDVAPRKVLSPAKMEAVFGRKRFPELFKADYDLISSGYNLVRESDPRRERVKASAQDDFT